MKWAKIIATLPPGLSAKEVSLKLGCSHNAAAMALRRLGYCAADGRCAGQRARRKLDPEQVDWTQGNAAIARQWDVSRQCVHQARSRRKADHLPDAGNLIAWL